MAETASASRRYDHQQGQPQSRSKQQYDRPHGDLTPQSSFSSASSYSVARGDSSGSLKQHTLPQQSQLTYLRSPAPSMVAPPSPVSPSSSSPLEAISSQLNLTRLNEPVQDRVSIQTYDRVVFQQPRVKATMSTSPGTSNLEQLYQAHNEPVYATPVLKQSGSSASTRSVSNSPRYPHQPELKQSSSSGSRSGGSREQSPSSPLRQSSRSGNGELKQSGSSASTRGPSNLQQNRSASPTPSSPILSYLPVAEDDTPLHERERDQAKHQEQALKFQQQLQQKPPSVRGNGEDGSDSDDSDSGSMLSYRRSISRLSMSYKRTNNGVPNISLFEPGQRPAMVSGGSGLTGSQKMIQEQREERLRQQQGQQQQGQQQQSSQTNNHQHQASSSPYVPERSSSADSYSPGGGNRSRYPGVAGQGGHSNPSSPSMAHRQLSAGSTNNQAPVEGSQNRSRSDRPSNLSPNDNTNNNVTGGPRSRSPGPMPPPSPRGPGSGYGGGGGGGGGGAGGPGGAGGAGGAGGMYRGINGSTSSLPPPPQRSAAPNPAFNPHPAHHLTSGGYVRPEEAMGPSNPMPEKAEDIVRQGIDYHELGDISKATHYFRTAAEMGDPVGMLMYGLAVRHGWGCQANRQLAFQYLQKSAEHAVGDLKSRDSFASTAAKGELVLAIYELGICFRHGWGVDKNKKNAAYYFEIAANLVSPSRDETWPLFIWSTTHILLDL